MNNNIKWILKNHFPNEIINLINLYSLPIHEKLNTDFKTHYNLFYHPMIRLHFIKKIERAIQINRLKSKLKNIKIKNLNL